MTSRATWAERTLDAVRHHRCDRARELAELARDLDDSCAALFGDVDLETCVQWWPAADYDPNATLPP